MCPGSDRFLAEPSPTVKKWVLSGKGIAGELHIATQKIFPASEVQCQAMMPQHVESTQHEPQNEKTSVSNSHMAITAVLCACNCACNAEGSQTIRT